jgi:pyruvate/2-oxoglutarate/acetoin dehydrogenase E1 component/TPP-dependent pyruvate/acetoin dehydrogenase alpha subunit
MDKEGPIAEKQEAMTFEDFKEEVLADYKLAHISRKASLTGRKEVLTGKAKFGIFGDGKELAQIALAKQFQNGDIRSGYYRDQTMMMAMGQLNTQQFFAQLYAHPDPEADPNSAGRQMTAHFSTPLLNEDGSWKRLTEHKNSAADASPVAVQMPRLLGLGLASKVYRELEELKENEGFSENGNEVAFGTIGDASTAEGIFWETFNAAGILQIPMVISVWDDGYGISVPKKYQTTKGDISEVLKGFEKGEDTNGYRIIKVRGWSYPELCKGYEEAVRIAREDHVPVLLHVDELTQPQGHSTSGSHERYKSQERMEWMKEFDCVNKFREWILEYEQDGQKLASEEELDALEKEADQVVKREKKAAWKALRDEIEGEKKEVIDLLENAAADSDNGEAIRAVKEDLEAKEDAIRTDILRAVRKGLRYARHDNNDAQERLNAWYRQSRETNRDRYNSHLYSEGEESPLKLDPVEPEYDADAEEVDGRIVLRDNFKALFRKDPRTMVFGEDSGYLGDVNQGLEGMQQEFGELRVADTGIREATIVGQGIGLAMRGLRPIAEIQYLDYLFYALQPITDDLATLRYRTKGRQKAPLIVRTRGHRLEGIWHSGSLMGSFINSMRGMHVCVPRNLTHAAGFYNTLLAGDDPALIVEPLNAYREKEKLPTNLGEFRTPLGVPELVREGEDLTIVSYGSTFNICQEAAEELEEVGISVELIDVRTLLPFDREHMIVESLKKTNRVAFIDEDVPGGTSAYMMNKVLEEQEAYFYLDSEPVTLTAHAHRPAYATDGDYFSKPNREDIFDTVYNVMREADPERFPAIYG